jgi:glutaconate CoA-transferase subunit A
VSAHAEEPERRSVVVGAAEALDDLRDGATVGIGGILTNGRPMTLVRELVRRGLRDLTIVAPVAALDVDLLIAAGCVRRVVTSYVGCEALAGVAPVFRAAVSNGQVEVWDGDEAHCVLGLRAAGQGLPFLPWQGGVGTDLPRINPELVEFEDPITGRPLLAVPAIPLDVALIHAERADDYGNVQFAGPPHSDPLLAAAAKRVVVQAEHVVGNDVIRRDPASTHRWRETAVVSAIWGTHPYASAGIEADADHLRAFAKLGRAAAKGDSTGLDEYVERHARGPEGHADYLETIGIRRILELVQ